MKLEELATHLQNLHNTNQAYSVAQVIHRQVPSSGKVGDKALVLESGEMIGWIGGGCVQGIVIQESLAAMADGKSRFVQVGEGAMMKENAIQYKMACHSKGSILFLIEPSNSRMQLIVVGRSRIAMHLVQIAHASQFSVHWMTGGTCVVPEFLKSKIQITKQITFDVPNTDYSRYAIVVSTQGEGDESAVAAALQTQAAYVGLIASKKKASQIKQALLKKTTEKHSILSEQISKLHAPAGLDLQAKEHSEVAISILAQIIKEIQAGNSSHQNSKKNTKEIASHKSEKTDVHRDSGTTHSKNKQANLLKVPKKFYKNPVCGILVSKETPKHIVSYKGEDIYFCCDGCKEKFEANPSLYRS